MGVIQTESVPPESTNKSEYSFSGEAMWQINGNELELNVVDMQTLESSKTIYEGADINNLFKSGSQENYQILNLTPDKLTLRHKHRDFVYHCSKSYQ